MGCVLIGVIGEVVYNGFIVFRGDILGGNYDMESYFNSALPADLPKSFLPRCTLPFDMAGKVGGLGGLVVGLVLFWWGGGLLMGLDGAEKRV